MQILLVVGMYALWASMFSLAKVALQYSPPIFLTGFRMSLAGVLILLFVFLKKRAAFNISSKQLFSIALLGLFSIYLTNVLECWALKYLSAAKTCFIYSLSPFFAALFSYIHFGEKMTQKKWIGLLIGFLGILPVLALQTGSEEIFDAVGFLSLPSLATIGAALFSVYGWVLLRILVKTEEVSPIFANGASMLFGGVMALVHSFYQETWNPFPVQEGASIPFLGWTLLMILISNVICFNLYGLMLRKFTATFLSFIGLLSPIFASLHSSVFLNEPFSWVICFSTVLVSFGLWIVYSAELKQGYIVKTLK